MYKRYNRKNKSEEDSIFEFVSMLVVLCVAYLGFVYYVNKKQFWYDMNHYVFPALGVITFVVCAYIFYLLQGKKKKELHFQSIIQQITETGLEKSMNSFIDQFGKEGKINSWEYRGYKFDWKRLGDFRESINKNKIIISNKDYTELSAVLKYFIDKKEKSYLNNGITTNAVHSLDELSKSGVEFENLIVRLYDNMGYVSKRVGGSGDQGADVIANKNGDSLLIQAKCYKEPVSNKAVQEAVAGRIHHGCTRAVVVTTASFTPGAVALAKSNSVELVNGELLKRRLAEYLQEVWL